VFDGISEEKIHELLTQAKEKKVKEIGFRLDSKGQVFDRAGRNRTVDIVNTDGKIRLYDGRTGDPFAQRVTSRAYLHAEARSTWWWTRFTLVPWVRIRW